MKLPSMRLPPLLLNSIPSPLNRFITRPLTVLLPAVILSPSAPLPALAPFNSMIGEPLKPCCEEPEMVTGSEIVGKGDAGEMVCGPGPGILNTIWSGPALALALRIACLSDPAPVSAVLVTVKVARGGGGRDRKRARA